MEVDIHQTDCLESGKVQECATDISSERATNMEVANPTNPQQSL